MRDYMFRNRWGAVLFVGLTLAGVTTLVGTESDGGALKQATEEIERQRGQAERMTGSAPAAAEEVPDDADIPLAADEELIDPATGEDPTPIDEFAPPAGEPTDPAQIEDVVIVSREPAPPAAAAPAEIDQ